MQQKQAQRPTIPQQPVTPPRLRLERGLHLAFRLFRDSGSLGFTLIELMFIVALTIAISSSIFLSLSGLGRRSQLSNVERSVKAVLREAQQKAISQDEGYYWGVRFTNSANDSYELFSTPDLAISTSITVKRVFLKSTLEFLSPPSESVATVLFKKINGELADANCPSAVYSANVSVGVVDQPMNFILNIFCNGRIE